MIVATRFQLTKTRDLTVNDDLTVTINDSPNFTFQGEVFAPRSGDGAAPDNSPRSGQRSKVWTTQPVLTPGDRFAGQDGSEHEVVTEVIQRRAAQAALAFEVASIPVAKLYPIRATLSDLGGAVVMEDLPLALWEGSEANTSRGTMDTLQAEAPAEFYNLLRITNRELLIGSRPFRIMSALLHRTSPHVRMTVRSPDG